MKLLKKTSFFLVSVFTIIFSFIYLSRINRPVAGEEPIEIYTIEDLDSVRNNLSGNYILMNDLDFNNPNSWVDYLNKDTIYKKIGPDRGTWSSASIQYTQYDRVLRSGVYYYAAFTHTSTTGNAPSTWSSFWVKTTNSTGHVIGWDPIGDYYDWINLNCFSGVFDGQNFQISNLYINNSGRNQSLFSCNEGVIKNISIFNLDLNGFFYVGGIVGSNQSDGIIKNINTSGSLSGTREIAGIAGENLGLIDTCSSDATITGYWYNTGGLVGDNSNGTIKDSYFRGNVILETGYLTSKGGLVGVFHSGSIENSYYNIDEVLIGGKNIITLGGIYNEEFTQWLNNGKYLNIDNYLEKEQEYYQINNFEDFRTLLFFGQVSGLKFKLNTNINLLPYPDFYIPYLTGEFDGNNNEILDLNLVTTDDNLGVFGFTKESSVIKNIGVTNIYIQGNTLLGGITGKNEGIIENSYSTGSINTSEGYVGGLSGTNLGQINNSYANVEVYGSYQVGGLVSSNYGTISNSYALGNVSAHSEMGGLVGINIGELINSYSTGQISDLSGWDYRVGGLVGSQSNNLIHNSFWNTETSGMSTSAGGTGKTTLEMQSISTFNDTSTQGLDEQWSIVNKSNFNPSNPTVWYIDNNEYPRLSMEFIGPEVRTNQASNIGQRTVKLSGELETIATEASVEVSFLYRPIGGDWISSTSLTKQQVDSFEITITDLIPNTTYQFHAVVSWRGIASSYGETKTFTTLAFSRPSTLILDNIAQIENLGNTEKELIFTKLNTATITFPPGLNMLENIAELYDLEQHIKIVPEPTNKRVRVLVNTKVLSSLSNTAATIKFTKVSEHLGVQLTTSNLRDLIYILVYDNDGNLVEDSTTYFNWDNVVYDQSTDTLTLPVNHFSEYVLGVEQEQLPETGMNILPFLLSGILIPIGYTMIIPKKKNKRE